MSRAKARRTARKCIEQLQNQGWTVGEVELGGKHRKQKDLFGLFDAVCVKGRETLFVQFKSNRPDTHCKFEEWSAEHSRCQQMVWYDRKGFVIFTYQNGERSKEDLRNV